MSFPLVCKLATLVLALGVSLASGAAQAQCTIGIFADPEGRVDQLTGLRDGDTFYFHVVMFVEDTVDAVAYSIDIPYLGEAVFVTGEYYGPENLGIGIESPNGINVGIGGCYPGFQGQPLLVTKYEAIRPFYSPPFTIRLGPNADAGGSTVYPVYSNCRGEILPCEVVLSLDYCNANDTFEDCPVVAEGMSFGVLKGLWAK